MQNRITVIYEGLSETCAVLLAGGLGTRLRDAVPDRPKVLAEVAGRPFIEYLFHQLRDAGVRKVIVSTGYRAQQIEERYGSEQGDLQIIYSREDMPLGTGGALRLALDKTRSSRVLVLNGDSYAGVNLERFYSHHRDTYLFMPEEGVSMALVEMQDAGRYGQVRFSENTKRVREFREKDPSAGAGWINAGLYLIPRELLQSIPKGKPCSLEQEVFPEWVRGGKLAVFPCAGATFIDIGTPESFRQAQSVFAGGART